MNKPFFKVKILATIFTACLLIASCSDDDNNNPLNQSISKEDVQKNLDLEKASAFVDNLIMDQSSDLVTPGRSGKNSNECIDVAFADGSYAITFTDCNIDGNTINGKINVSYTIADQAITSSISFEGFTFNDSSIEGNKTTEYSANFTDLTFMYSVTSDLAINIPNVITGTIKGTKKFEISGGLTENTIIITGNWDVTINGESYSLVIDPSLRGTSVCGYIVEGVLTITENGSSASIDYGDGICDNIATVTYPDGTSEEIEL
ncbi:hypothetical protein [Aquimarina sp. MMG016]|uniref:hypothetical protein n=1 Tax=Aquimarina sp. MMG016 TaxID=2822690 RepID=UPI001B3A50FE|nr:hypothetical protein [Aquimarina sp. MMG016]MBQ4819329.1 hypothetical protein [Aquimarina sp. MMG016]